jgi:hypothetical protein
LLSATALALQAEKYNLVTSKSSLKMDLMYRLKHAIYTVMTVGDEYEQACANVWDELKRVDPDLIKEIEKLNLRDEDAAEWICPNRHEAESSPAELVVNGRRDKVLAKVERLLRLDSAAS